MKPFQGILIADFTHVLSGPFCTKLLGELGARIIKLERVGLGDDSRQFGPFVDNKSLYFDVFNQGKESVAVDLKSSEDKKFVQNLLRKADVLVENFKPGTMNKLGLDYETVKILNPKLIYASISGFGQKGSMAKLPAYDEIIQALSGFMSLTGEINGPPIKAGPSVADFIAGVYAFGAIASALYQREKTQKGCQIDIAMFDCLLSFLANEIATDEVLHQIPHRVGNRHRSISPFSTFQCKDDQIVICAANDELFKKACMVLNLEELSENAECKNNKGRIEQYDLIKQSFEKILQRETVDYWYHKFLAAGVPAAPINDIHQAVSLPCVSDRELLIHTGSYKLPACPVRISTLEDNAIKNPAPTLDEHGKKIRNEFNNDDK